MSVATIGNLQVASRSGGRDAALGRLARRVESEDG